LAGQVIMQGFLRRKIPLFARRLVTMLPALAVIGLGFDPTRTLVVSQVVLSFGIPFALVPLVLFTSRRKLMGPLTNHPATTAAAAVMAALIVGLNAFLILQVLAPSS
jgi:manganese transport protein